MIVLSALCNAKSGHLHGRSEMALCELNRR